MGSISMLVKTSVRPALLGAVVGALLLGGCEKPKVEQMREQARGYMQEQEYNDALKVLQDAYALNKFDPQTNYELGRVYTQLGKYQQAEYHYKLSWQADPSRPELKDAIVETLIKEGKEDKALDFLERDASLTAKAEDPRKNLHPKVPVQPSYFETRERMFANKTNDRLRVARVYERIGDLDNARINYERTLAMAPNDAALLTIVGDFYARIGNKVAARDKYQQAYAIEPAQPGLVDKMTAVGLSVSK